MRRRRLATAVVAVAVASLSAAGCGGASAPSTAGTAATGTAPSTAGSAPRTGALAFARCMRAHGFPQWPDPTTSGAFDKSQLRRLNYSVTRVRAAEEGPCNRLLPQGGPSGQGAQPSQARMAAYLAFARCMRSRGFPTFPDPTRSGELSHAMLAGAGIDVRQRAVLQAADGCTSVTHGFVTRASVARFAAGG